MEKKYGQFEIVKESKSVGPPQEIGAVTGVLAMARKNGKVCFVLRTRFGRRYVLQPGFVSSPKLGSHLWEQVLVSGQIDRKARTIKAKTIVPMRDPDDDWIDESYNFGSEVQVTHMFDRIRGQGKPDEAA